VQTETFYLAENAPRLVLAGRPKFFVHDSRFYFFFFRLYPAENTYYSYVIDDRYRIIGWRPTGKILTRRWGGLHPISV